MEKNKPEMPQEIPPQSEAMPVQEDDGIGLLESELAGIQNELAQNEASLENDFAKFLSENLTADDEELFFENKETFFKKILDKQNEFFNEKIALKKQRAGELESQITQKKTLANIERAESDFLKENPNADVRAMFDYFANDLPPRLQRELESLEPREFFKRLYEIFKTKDQSQVKEAKEDEIPKHYEATNIDAQAAQSDSEESYFNRM